MVDPRVSTQCHFYQGRPSVRFDRPGHNLPSDYDDGFLDPTLLPMHACIGNIRIDSLLRWNGDCL